MILLYKSSKLFLIFMQFLAFFVDGFFGQHNTSNVLMSHRATYDMLWYEEN